MKPIIFEKTINAPVELVFKTIAHIEEFSKVVDDIVCVEFLSEKKTGLGARFRETRMMKGKDVTTELEVKEYIENKNIRIVSDTQSTVWDTLFSVKEENGVTVLTTTLEARTNNLFMKLMNLMIRGMIAKAVEKDMNAVKVYCEK